MRTANKMLKEALTKIDTLESRLNAIEMDLPLMKRLIPDFIKINQIESKYKKVDAKKPDKLAIRTILKKDET